MSSGSLEAEDFVRNTWVLTPLPLPVRMWFLLETEKFIKHQQYPVFVNIPLNGRKHKVSKPE